MSDLLIALATLPLWASLGCLLWPRLADLLSPLVALALVGCSLLLLDAIAATPVILHHLGGWGGDLGISLRADALSALLLALGTVVTLAATLFARRYFTDDQVRYRFWPLWWLLNGAINALLLSADLFNLYVTLELLGLSAAALCTLGKDKPQALRAALRYLLLGLIGSLLYLTGVALVYAEYGTLAIPSLAQQIQASPASLTALLLLSSGLLIKCALLPLHIWLPAAHSSAPAPVSAVLSALVVKVTFYLLLRLWFELFTAVITPAFATLIGTMGATAVIWGSWRALMSTRLKLMAAYSTVSQMGYLFLFVPILLALPDHDSRALAFGALVLFALNHGIAKAALFLAIGIIQQRLGHDQVDRINGVARQLPVTLFAVALAGSALVGLPPSGAFLAKWTLISASLVTAQWWWLLVAVIGTLLAAAYLVRVLGAAFAPAEPPPPTGKQLLSGELPALLLAAMATLGLGLGAAPIWSLLAPTGLGNIL
ncbi:complex I subunit 5 family protein [Motiliproteus sediminis]|uniref:complex I subunit 5 family protein n=1 Tax=Motiliproteus sediminis TaxID=1468178 RepID=UPI001AEF44DE|nr:proton-conducting transporter membrane subunit [Motiliproteus sediminis]